MNINISWVWNAGSVRDFLFIKQVLTTGESYLFRFSKLFPPFPRLTFITVCPTTSLYVVICDVKTIQQKFTQLLVSSENDKRSMWQLGQMDNLLRIFHRKHTSNTRLILNKYIKTYLIEYQTGNLNEDSFVQYFPLLLHGFLSVSSLFSL